MQQAHLFVRYRLWNYRVLWLALKFSDRPDGAAHTVRVAVRITWDQWFAAPLDCAKAVPETNTMPVARAIKVRCIKSP